IIVDADRGEDFGYVHAVGELAEKRSRGCAHGCGHLPGTNEPAGPARRALRIASDADVRQAGSMKKLSADARRQAAEKVKGAGLQMKISDAEWQWDRRKLTLFFTAEKRVDFRNLVRDLAALFKTRIELKQIGVRDEAKRLDGIGRCGRQYCSASWLPELRPVNLGVAKDQRLSLNPSQISGACGRLMCCLRYEHEMYVTARKRFPKEGRTFATPRGEVKVIANDIFQERITVRAAEGETRMLSLAEFAGETGFVPPAAAATIAESRDADDPADTADTADDLALVEELIAEERAGSAPVELADIPATGSQFPATSGDEAQTAARRRRRGRRGGRKNRGPKQGD
ncbi:MAG TPA: regulatory iron-sulfur-containing complex subunit RicT, partial [Gemmatimonadaceae bacterium]|nr:regulatory iron-sulfur-containing complex subunit RicT [Gemmatimonadaceae bacterium]